MLCKPSIHISWLSPGSVNPLYHVDALFARTAASTHNYYAHTDTYIKEKSNVNVNTMAVPKKTLLNLDVFAKTEDDVKVKTATGGLITLTCILSLLYIISSEFATYNSISMVPELVVDRDSGLKMEINLDVSFPHMPCDLLNLDIMDETGEFQLDLLSSGFKKIRLNSEGKEIAKEEMKIGEESELPEDYCGSCYSARDQSRNDQEGVDKVCCNTCDDVRRAYSELGWAFYDGKDIEQCEREGTVKKVEERLYEGCRVKGTAQVSRVNGNLHFAPGSSINLINGRHSHDLSLYNNHKHFNFDHKINHYSYGPAGHNALDGIEGIDGRHDMMYSYFTKVIPTRYEYLNGQKVESTQYSSTKHSRPLMGGRDDDHPNTFHGRGGFPGVSFWFEMSPLKVINRESHGMTFGALVLNILSAVGGVLAVGSVVDRIGYAAEKKLKSKKDI